MDMESEMCLLRQNLRKEGLSTKGIMEISIAFFLLMITLFLLPSAALATNWGYNNDYTYNYDSYYDSPRKSYFSSSWTPKSNYYYDKDWNYDKYNTYSDSYYKPQKSYHRDNFYYLDEYELEEYGKDRYGPTLARVSDNKYGSYTTDYVVDGDTFDHSGKRYRIIGIDTPEKGQYNFEQAKNRLGELLKGWYEIEEYGTDIYGRTLAKVSVNGRDVADILRSEGFQK